MINLNFSILKKYSILMIIYAVVFIHAAAAAGPLIERIHLGDSVNGIRIKLSERAPYKVIQVEPREFLVAFKSTGLSKKVEKSSADKHVVKQVKIDRLPDNVVTLVFHSGSNIHKISSGWADESGSLAIRLFIDEQTAKPGVSVKQATLTKKEITTPPPKKQPSPKSISVASVSSPAPGPSIKEEAVVEATPMPESHDVQKIDQRPKKKMISSLDDILSEIKTHECSEASDISDVLEICEKKNWRDAFEQINKQRNMKAEGDCQEQIYFLRAYLNFKMNRSGQDSIYLDGVTYFQDAIIYFPDSPLVPYAMLALGKTFKELKNLTEAKGYFKIVLKDYPTYIGRFEAMYELGQIYAVEDKSKQAIATFKQFLGEYPESQYAANARKALGKVLYESNEFKEALAVLTVVMAEDSKSVFKDKDLLLTIGNLHYQLGNYIEARKALIKTVNYYPNQTATPVLMTRIADTFRDTNQPEEADKIYRFVMETHPGTDGFAISAIRHAASLSKRSEKEDIYHRVISEYADHPMAKLAKVKLADLQLQAGEYNTSINTLREMAAANLKDLKNEAVYVLESSFEALFSRLSENNAFTEILAAYERDKRLINRLDNPKIFEAVGAAFLEGHLYSQAATVLKKAYKLTNHRNRPESLYYRLGIAFQETGKTLQAKELFYAYFEAVPKEQRKTAVYLRISQLLTDENAHEKSFDFLKMAYKQSQSNSEKVEILMQQAASLKIMGQLEKIPSRLIDAINILVDSGDHAFKDVNNAYQVLGETYIKLADFDKAVDAYTMALKFSEENRPPGLLFSLAESYRMAQAPAKARNILTEILGSGDDFWVRVAQEKMNSLALVDKLKQT
jgi:TolA-binding protein